MVNLIIVMVSFGKGEKKELMIDSSLEQSLAAVERELRLRKARTSYLEYVKFTNQGYKESAFHNYLCNEIQKFMETDVAESFDILLLSVP